MNKIAEQRPDMGGSILPHKHISLTKNTEEGKEKGKYVLLSSTCININETKVLQVINFGLFEKREG